MKGKPIILTLFFISLCRIGCSQKNINLLAMPMGDSILLRWSPTDVESWEHGLNNGYQIQRAVVEKENLKDFSFAKTKNILIDKVIVWSEEKWKNNHNTQDEWEMIAAGMVYGDLGIDMDAPSLDPEVLEDRNLARNNRFAIGFHAANHSVDAAKKLGLMYVDKDVQPEQAYVYSVRPYPLDSDDSSEDYFLIEMNNIEPLPIPEIYGAEWGDKEVSIVWDHYTWQASFVSYIVERSADGGLTWEIRNEAPVVPGEDLKEAVLTSFVDSLDNNDVEYQYRIIGHSPFGINSDPSELIAGNGHPLFANIEIELFLPIENENHIQLSWAINKSNQIEEYNIYRSAAYVGPYSRINSKALDPFETSFDDSDPVGTNFYYVEAISKDGKSHTSLRRMINKKDVTPPGVPSHLTCSLDTMQGGIILNWDNPKEADFAGHRIFASYRAEDGYQDIADTLVQESKYLWSTETVRNGEVLYFKIQAQDNRFNRSAYSDYCAVQLLDMVPPEPPLIRKIIDTKNRVVFEWASSPSYDVVYHEIWRLSDLESWKIILRYDSAESVNRMSDTLALIVDKEYQYKIIAIDQAGNFSESNIKNARVWKSKMAPAIKNFNVLIEKNTGSTLLSWQYLKPKYIDKVEIYRQNQEGIPFRYQVLSSEEINKRFQDQSENAGAYYWIDPQNQNGVKYAYAVRILLKNGDVTTRTPWKKESTSNE